MNPNLNGVQFKHAEWERTSKGATSRGLEVTAEHPKYGRIGEMHLPVNPDANGNREILDMGVLFKRQGVGTGMLRHAQESGLNPVHSSWRTDEGDAWARKVGGPLPDRDPRR